MHTAFDHPQFGWPRFHISAPAIHWATVPGTTGNPTYTNADDLAIEWYGDVEPEPACPHRFTDHEALECSSGNCSLAAQELFDALMHNHQDRLHVDTCDGYVSDGPSSCICPVCADASVRHHLPEPPMPIPVLRQRFTLLRLWCWLTGQQ
jgi:hypothetical protein